MVQVSDAASTLLLDSLVKAAVPPEVGYRLALAQAGYKLRMDRPADEDRVVRKEGHVVLMIEPDVDDQLEGVVLDVKDGDEGRLILEAS